jgi:hypothetical protein
MKLRISDGASRARGAALVGPAGTGCGTNPSARTTRSGHRWGPRAPPPAPPARDGPAFAGCARGATWYRWYQPRWACVVPPWSGRARCLPTSFGRLCRLPAGAVCSYPGIAQSQRAGVGSAGNRLKYLTNSGSFASCGPSLSRAGCDGARSQAPGQAHVQPGSDTADTTNRRQRTRAGASDSHPARRPSYWHSTPPRRICSSTVPTKPSLLVTSAPGMNICITAAPPTPNSRPVRGA